MTRIIGRDDIAKFGDIKEFIEPVQKGFAHIRDGRYRMSDIELITVANGGMNYSVTTHYPEENIIAVRTCSLYRNNMAEYSLPARQERIMLLDDNNGSMVALLNAVEVSRIRNGVLTAIATDKLALRGAVVAGIYGAGSIGRAVMKGIYAVRDIEATYIYDKIPQRAEAFKKEMSRELSTEVIVAMDPRDVIEKAEIITTATNSHKPVFPGAHARPGTHINSIGIPSPDVKELDHEILKRSKIVVDHRELCLTMAGDIADPIKSGVITQDSIMAEMADIIHGGRTVRERDDDITLFKSVGHPLIDTIIAIEIYRDAVNKNIGKEIEL